MTDKMLSVAQFNEFVDELRGGAICDEHWKFIRRCANVVIGIQPCLNIALRNVLRKRTGTTDVVATVVSDHQGDPGLVDLATGEYLTGDEAVDLEIFGQDLFRDGWVKIADSVEAYYMEMAAR